MLNHVYYMLTLKHAKNVLNHVAISIGQVL